MKHIVVWGMVMCMLFFAAAPVARTNLWKWIVVGVIAAVFSEALVAAAKGHER